MTHAQEIAIAHHCRLACETAQVRFARALSIWPHQVSCVLTVNSGYE